MDKVTASLKRHWLPATAAFASVIGSALFYLSKTPSQYEASMRLIVDDQSVSISPLGQDLSNLKNQPPGNANPLATQSEMVKSQQVLGRVINRLEDKPEMANADLSTGALAESLSVTILPATNILEVTYKDIDPKVVPLVLNAVAESLVEESAESIRSGASSVRKFLEERVPEQRARLERAEFLEDRYRQKSGLVSPEDQTRNLVNSLTQVESEERSLLTQLQAAYTRTAALGTITDSRSLKAAYDAVGAGQNPALATLQAKLTDLETQIINARSRLGDQHPDLLALLQQRDETRQLYAQDLGQILTNDPNTQPAANDLSQTLISNFITGEIERSALEAQLKVVQASRARLAARLQQLPVEQQPLTTLIREREDAATTLAALQRKLEDARIAEAQLVSNIRVIDYPGEPIDPSWPKPLAVLVVAAAAGSILGAGVIMLLELMDNTVRSVPEAAEILELPILGVLPKFSKPQTLDQFLQHPELVEPYQMFLRTLTIRAQEPLRMIAISSISAEEGKSTVVSHLAAVASLTKRTLIIDADLRRPSQSQQLGVESYPGLTDVLRGDVSLSDAIRPTALPALSVLTQGTPSSYPAAVLSTEGMQQFWLEVRASYDLVIIDTPPISLCAETTTLAQQSDALVMVVRPHLTVKDQLREVVKELLNNGLPLVGIVVNGVKRPIHLYYPFQLAQLPQSALRQFQAVVRNTDQN